MITLAAKTHWRVAYRQTKRAIKETVRDIVQHLKAKRYIKKTEDALYKQRVFFAVLDREAEDEKV